MRAGAAISVVAFLAACAQTGPVVLPAETGVVVAAAVQQPTMIAYVPSLGARGGLTIAGQNNGVVTWRTQDYVTLSFDNGVLVGSRGLGDDLMGADVTQAKAALRNRSGEWFTRVYSYLDGENQPYFVTFNCRITNRASEQVTVADRIHTTTHVVESCVNEKQEITNQYWLGQDGTMWQSRQWISGSAGYLEMQRAIR